MFDCRERHAEQATSSPRLGHKPGSWFVCVCRQSEMTQSLPDCPSELSRWRGGASVLTMCARKRLASLRGSPASQRLARYDPWLHPRGPAVCFVFRPVARTTRCRTVRRYQIYSLHEKKLVPSSI